MAKKLRIWEVKWLAPNHIAFKLQSKLKKITQQHLIRLTLQLSFRLHKTVLSQVPLELLPQYGYFSLNLVFTNYNKMRYF